MLGGSCTIAPFTTPYDDKCKKDAKEQKTQCGSNLCNAHACSVTTNETDTVTTTAAMAATSGMDNDVRVRCSCFLFGNHVDAIEYERALVNRNVEMECVLNAYVLHAAYHSQYFGLLAQMKERRLGRCCIVFKHFSERHAREATACVTIVMPLYKVRETYGVSAPISKLVQRYDKATQFVVMACVVTDFDDNGWSVSAVINTNEHTPQHKIFKFPVHADEMCKRPLSVLALYDPYHEVVLGKWKRALAKGASCAEASSSSSSLENAKAIMYVREHRARKRLLQQHNESLLLGKSSSWPFMGISTFVSKFVCSGGQNVFGANMSFLDHKQIGEFLCKMSCNPLIIGCASANCRRVDVRDGIDGMSICEICCGIQYCSLKCKRFDAPIHEGRECATVLRFRKRISKYSK